MLGSKAALVAALALVVNLWVMVAIKKSQNVMIPWEHKEVIRLSSLCSGVCTRTVIKSPILAVSLSDHAEIPSL